MDTSTGNGNYQFFKSQQNNKDNNISNTNNTKITDTSKEFGE